MAQAAARPGRSSEITTAEKRVNALLNRERAVAEHDFADLKNWRILTKLPT